MSARLTWTIPQTNGTIISGYQLERSRGGAAYTLIYTGTALTFRDANSVSGDLYRVRAMSNNGAGPYSSVSTYTVGSTGAVALTWAMANPYGTGGSSADAYARGFKVQLLEIDWASAEPTNNGFSSTYFTNARNKINQWKAEGSQVILNYGLHHAPDWVFQAADLRFVDNNGKNSSTLVSGPDQPAFHFNPAARDLYGQRYTSRVLAELGTDWYAIRVGGSHWGELNYPDTAFGVGASSLRTWWAFSPLALQMMNDLGLDSTWRPGQTSTNHDKARAFWGFYRDRLSDYLNWQIQSLRNAGYSGIIATLQASDGTREGDLAATNRTAETAIVTDLNGSTGIENNEMKLGYDHRHMMLNIPDNVGPIAAWATSSARHDPVLEIAHWADQRGWRKMCENANDGSYEEAAASQRYMLQSDYDTLLWIRGEQAWSNVGASESATSMTCGIEALTLITQAGRNPVHVVDDFRTFKTVSPWNPWRTNQWTVTGNSQTNEITTAGGVLRWDGTVTGASARVLARCGWESNASQPMPAIGDCELLARFAFSDNTALARLEFHLRASGDWHVTNAVPTSSYWIEMTNNGATATVKKSVAGTLGTIGTYTSTAGVTTAQQWVRFQIVGSDIKAKHWTGLQSAEPVAWDTTLLGVAGEVAKGVHQMRFTRSSTNVGDKSVTFTRSRVTALV